MIDTIIERRKFLDDKDEFDEFFGVLMRPEEDPEIRNLKDTRCERAVDSQNAEVFCVSEIYT